MGEIGQQLAEPVARQPRPLPQEGIADVRGIGGRADREHRADRGDPGIFRA